ncbi:hypothetical protein [Consotaella salsifontis]|uniref:Uncharacterized protein n=1 Tax=Consotaella salsifontis TaxID=1365950 RepID=A0A1T4RE56_9HYPH|nr:hypothetical protein [Consotaella salsifontis]SKA14177.1 hypothetical protein SAMN05428963_106238 [Consotaella salsifontis]
MLALALLFLLGFFVATLAGLLLAPILWRKAQFFAWRDFEASVPTTSNEIRGQMDFVRAEAAASVRRQEIAAEETAERAARERAEAGRVIIENADLRIQGRALERRIAELNEEIASLRSDVASQAEENERLASALDSTRSDLASRTDDLAILDKRFRDLADIAEERKVAIVALETKQERSADSLRSAEKRIRELEESGQRAKADAASLEASLKREKTHAASLAEKLERQLSLIADRDEEIERLRSDINPGVEGSFRHQANELTTRSRSLRDAVQRSEANGTLDEEAIRDRIGDIAARVIRLTALAEGPASPLSPMVGDSADAVPERDASGAPSLAERVRTLAERDRQKLPPPGYRPSNTSGGHEGDDQA